MTEDAKPEPKKDPVSQDEIDAIKKDIEAATQSLGNKNTNDAVEKALKEERARLEREFELQKKLEEQERKAKELEAKLAEQQKKAEESLTQLRTKVDEMVSSKQVINTDPALRPPAGLNANRYSDSDINLIEENAARQFLGPAYDRVKNGLA